MGNHHCNVRLKTNITSQNLSLVQTALPFAPPCPPCSLPAPLPTLGSTVVRAENQACTLPLINKKKTIIISTLHPSALLRKIKSKPPSKASHCLGMLHQVCARLRTVLTIMKKELLDCRERLSLERDQKCHGMVDTSSFRHVCIFLACW